MGAGIPLKSKELVQRNSSGVLLKMSRKLRVCTRQALINHIAVREVKGSRSINGQGTFPAFSLQGSFWVLHGSQGLRSGRAEDSLKSAVTALISETPGRLGNCRADGSVFRMNAFRNMIQ